MDDDMFTKLADDWTALSSEEKKALFESTAYETASADDLAALGRFKILNFSDSIEKPELSLRAVPKDRLVFPREYTRVESFEGVNKATLTETLSGNGICKLLVTDDMKKYQTYDFAANEWKVVDHTDIEAVKSTGINAAKFADIDRASWDRLLHGKSGIGFAYLIGIDHVADQCAIDQSALQVDEKGDWKDL